MTPFPTSTGLPLPTAEPINPDTQDNIVTSTVTPFPSLDFTNTPLPTAISGVSDATDAPIGDATRDFALPTLGVTFLPTRDGGQAAATPTPFGFGGSTGVIASSGGISIRSSDGTFIASDGSPVAGGAFSYDFGPDGQTAAFYGTNELFVNGVPLRTSPASTFGLGADEVITQIRWSPNGALVAFIIHSDDPANFDRGVWVYNPGAGVSTQLLRTDYRRPLDMLWSPNSGALLIKLNSESPPGITHTILAMDANANDPNYIMHTYSDGTWAPDSGSVVFSGRNTDGSIVLGRVELPDQYYVPITATAPDVVFTYAAIQAFNGQIYFLGSSTEFGPFRLYSTTSVGGTALAVSSTSVSGQIVSSEWDANRSALLLLLDVNGTRRAYLLSIGGGVTDITPASGVGGGVRWR